MAQPTASRSEILIHCSWWLDPSLELPADEGGEPARYGSAFHEVMASCILDAMPLTKKPDWYAPQIDAAAQRWHVRAASAELAGHVWSSFGVLRTWLNGKNPWGINWVKSGRDLKREVETSYALDVAHPGALSRKIKGPTIEDHVYEELRAGEVAGTLDLMVLPSDTTAPPLILDHKTGSDGNLSSPSELAQLRTLALIPDRGDVLVSVLHADRRGLPMIYADELEVTTLQKHRTLLRRAIERVGDGSMNPGPWCVYCRARPICPTQFSKLIPDAMAIVQASGAIVEAPADGLATAHDVGKFHLLLKAMSKLVEKGEVEIKNWVKDHPDETVIRPDGKHLAFITKEYESVSKTSIVEALGKVEGERLIEKLRKLGVVKKGSREELHALID